MMTMTIAMMMRLLNGMRVIKKHSAKKAKVKEELLLIA